MNIDILVVVLVPSSCYKPQSITDGGQGSYFTEGKRDPFLVVCTRLNTSSTLLYALLFVIFLVSMSKREVLNGGFGHVLSPDISSCLMVCGLLDT